jgi:hypothetical protein
LARGYDESIDDCIILKLLTNDTLSSGILKKVVELRLSRAISPDVFFPHLSKMVANGELIKVDEGRGRHVYYSVSEYTKKQRQLNILRISDKQVIFKKIYEKILLWEFYEGLYKRTTLPSTYLGIYEDVIVPYDILKRSVIDSKAKLDDFLSGLQIGSDAILWGTLVFGAMGLCTQLIDEIKSHSRFTKRTMKRYCDEKMKDKPKVYDDVVRFCYPKKDDKDLIIYAMETWEIEKDKNKKYHLTTKLFKTRYIIFMPGVTIQDIAKDNLFNLTEIQDAIKKLEEGGLIKYKVYGGQIRYVVADKDLRLFINDLKDLLRNELDILLYKWENLQSPTAEERSRMERIFGKEQFSKMSLKCEMKLHNLKRKIRACKTIEEYNELLKENADFGPTHIVLDISLDKYKRKRKEDWKRATEWGKRNRLWKENAWKRNEEPKTLKEHRESIKGFWNFLGDKIRASLIDVSSYNKTILEKYGFLSDLFKLIWPKIPVALNKDQLQA